ncbi:hypothetical protein D3C78_1872460 [compost metagenome]
MIAVQAMVRHSINTQEAFPAAQIEQYSLFARPAFRNRDLMLKEIRGTIASVEP